MTVAELIAELQRFPAGARVVISDADTGWDLAGVQVDGNDTQVSLWADFGSRLTFTGKAEPPPTWVGDQQPVTAAALHEAVLDILSKASAPMTKADLIVAAQARVPNAGIQEISDAIDRGTTATRYLDQATGEELPPPPEGYHWRPPTRQGEKES